jgi:TRAP-type mannitol/chloroaromatic compound transport system permease small subunit
MSVIDNINMWIAKLTSFSIILIMAILVIGAIMRYVFHQALFWEGDIAWLLFVFCSVLAGAYVLRQDRHVRLDVIHGRLNERQKTLMDIATFSLFLLFFGILSWVTVNKAIWSVSILERSGQSYFHVPLYPARLSLALGSVLLLLQGVSEFIKRIVLLLGNKVKEKALEEDI